MFYPFSPSPLLFSMKFDVFLFCRERKFVVDFFFAFVFVFIVARAVLSFSEIANFGNFFGKRGDSMRGMFFFYFSRR